MAKYSALVEIWWDKEDSVPYYRGEGDSMMMHDPNQQHDGNMFHCVNGYAQWFYVEVED